ncbi:transketolase [uncultured Methanoregula sp.]|uniref:transketolase n=1 Tax=uncultured Methanoregula sp. TaxID=1005933 RepID=UPI002AABA754|nr:transketolase [uncultured Methanoregula sp.]
MTPEDPVIQNIGAMAKRMRKKVLDLALSAGNNGAHVGSALSIIEIMAVLYGGIMKINPENPRWEGRDRFILSKGHGSLGYYTALAEAGLITFEELDTFEKNGGFLPGQPVMNPDKGIEFSSGSLGHGLSLGTGVALAGKKQNAGFRVYVLMGDGECNEGSVWEAAMAARHYKLSNLTAIIDANDMQSDGARCDIMAADYEAMWRGCGWDVVVADGHDVRSLYGTLRTENPTGMPRVIIAKTVKGKGVSFMEGNNEWHHNRLTQAQYDTAVRELNL